mgnify:CR=1 FL=1
MDTNYLESQLRQTQARFQRELEILHSQGIINEVDIRKIMSQAEVSKGALLESIKRKDLIPQVQEELVTELVRDYQLSVQSIIDNAILRLGPHALLSYKFNQVDEKVRAFVADKGFSDPQSRSLQGFMEGARAYALKALRGSQATRTPAKVDFQGMVNDYAAVIEECVQRLQSSAKFIR